MLQEILSNTIKSESIPWFFRKKVTSNFSKSTNGYFSFCFYNNHKPDHKLFEPLILPILQKLNFLTCIQVRANLAFRDIDAKESDYHVDYDHPNVTTGILYLTNCNGKTVLQIGDKEVSVDSVENRFVMFPAQTQHKLIYHTDVHKRYVINFNFIGA